MDAEKRKLLNNYVVARVGRVPDAVAALLAERDEAKDALASISRYVSWCKHGEADRGTTLDKIDAIASEALRG